MRKIVASLLVAIVVGAGSALAAIGLIGPADAGGRHHAITICHRTNSRTKPYVRVTVDAASTEFAGHERHIGSIWSPARADQSMWGDIIPPTTDDHARSVTPLNWHAGGQALWNNGCRPKFGPPPEPPTITCKWIKVDPPSTSFITVTFHGTINGMPFTRSASYGTPTPHWAIADITDLTHPGRLHIVAHATWTLGAGASPVADVTIVCHPKPKP